MKKQDKEKNYEDIINLPHHVSPVHPPMPLSDRAAQFAPFAALTGYGDVIKETARQTDRKPELTEEESWIISFRWQFLFREKNRRLRLLTLYLTRRKQGDPAAGYRAGSERPIQTEEYLLWRGESR